MHGVKKWLKYCWGVQSKTLLKIDAEIQDSNLSNADIFVPDVRGRGISWLLFVQQLFQSENNKSLVSYHKIT